MRILCISPFFPPIRDSEAFCGGKMVRALAGEGADVTVLYMTAAYLQEKQDDSQLWRPLQAQSIPIGPGSSRQRVRAAFCSLKYRITIWPRWIDNVLQTAQKLHAAAPFQVVYSRSLPMFAQVAGYWVARKLGLPWIANINDPWDEHLFPGVETTPASLLHKRLSLYWLKKTLVEAEAVTFPSLRLARFTARLGACDRQGEILPHAGFRSDCPEAPAEGFRLVHAGKLGSGEITGRSTRALLAGLRRFLDRAPGARSVTRLVLVGPEDPRNRPVLESLGLNSHVVNVGQVNYQESLRHIASASACILVEADMPEGIYLPSKLADYLVAAKPVLALSPQVGTISDLSSERGIMRVDPGDEGQIEQAFARLYRSYVETGLADCAPSDDLVQRFTGPRLAASFLGLAADVCRRHSPHSAGADKLQEFGAATLAGSDRFDAPGRE